MTLQLLHGDCLELMKTLPDKSIDLFICDLPYGCLGPVKKGGPSLRDPNKPSNVNERLMRMENGVTTGKRADTGNGVLGGCEWDIPIDLEAFWIQVKRLCKDDHTPVLMFCTTKFGFELYNSNPEWFRYDLVWNKMRGVSFLLANKMPMRSHELIYVFSKKGATYYRKDIEGDFKKTTGSRGCVSNQYGVVLTGDTDNTGKRCVLSVIDHPTSNARGGHPTQKPDDLYEWLITRYSKEGDTMLDATAGSFASCFTAQRLGRNAIGIELNKEFYDKAVEKNTPV
jgi:site-specific DNA-methyltransferase (adenine-specific)